MKVFKEQKEQPKSIAVILRDKRLQAVDGVTGEWIATLFLFEEMRPANRAFGLISGSGYRTDFASWGADGEMIKLLEDFE